MTDFLTLFAPRLFLDTVDLYTDRHYKPPLSAVYAGAARCRGYICNSQVSYGLTVSTFSNTYYTYLDKKPK